MARLKPPDWSEEDATRTFVRVPHPSKGWEWTAPTLELVTQDSTETPLLELVPEEELSKSDWELTVPRTIPPTRAAPLPLPRVALPPIASLPSAAPVPLVRALPRPGPLPRLAPLPRPAAPPRAPSLPPIAPLPQRPSAAPPPRRSSGPVAAAPSSLPPIPAFTVQAEAHFPPASRQAPAEPPVIVHQTEPPPPPPPPAPQELPRVYTPPPPMAMPSLLPQPAPSRLSRTLLAFVAIYVAAALLLVLVLVVRHHSADSVPLVTATDTQGASIGVASVFVDGREVCAVLPCRLTEPKGRHWISIHADGYAPAEPIEATGDGPVHFTLKRLDSLAASQPAVPPSTSPVASSPPPPAAHSAEVASLPPTAPAPTSPPEQRAAPVRTGPAYLSFYSHPSALVLLDGRPLGSTPRPRVTVAPGSHTVLFVHDGRRVARGAMAVAGRNVGISARF